jgi:hypothetical protein
MNPLVANVLLDIGLVAVGSGLAYQYARLRFAKIYHAYSLKLMMERSVEMNTEFSQVVRENLDDESATKVLTALLNSKMIQILDSIKKDAPQ